jgi:hypothetical protein
MLLLAFASHGDGEYASKEWGEGEYDIVTVKVRKAGETKGSRTAGGDEEEQEAEDECETRTTAARTERLPHSRYVAWRRCRQCLDGYATLTVEACTSPIGTRGSDRRRRRRQWNELND